MDEQLASIMDEFIAEVETIRMPHKYRTFLGDENPNHIPNTRRKWLPGCQLAEKEFQPRNSPLTDLFEINHIQTIYHIFIAILVLLFMNTIVVDVVEHGRIDLDFELIHWAFGGLHTVCVIWVGTKKKFTLHSTEKVFSSLGCHAILFTADSLSSLSLVVSQEIVHQGWEAQTLVGLFLALLLHRLYR